MFRGVLHHGLECVISQEWVGEGVGVDGWCLKPRGRPPPPSRFITSLWVDCCLGRVDGSEGPSGSGRPREDNPANEEGNEDAPVNEEGDEDAPADEEVDEDAPTDEEGEDEYAPTDEEGKDECAPTDDPRTSVPPPTRRARTKTPPSASGGGQDEDAPVGGPGCKAVGPWRSRTTPPSWPRRPRGDRVGRRRLSSRWEDGGKALGPKRLHATSPWPRLPRGGRVERLNHRWAWEAGGRP